LALRTVRLRRRSGRAGSRPPDIARAPSSG
jgi:hypothetical protein